jgi:hypothetical protein
MSSSLLQRTRPAALGAAFFAHCREKIADHDRVQPQRAQFLGANFTPTSLTFRSLGAQNVKALSTRHR